MGFHLKLWRWAVQLGYVAVDPMANIQPADKWGINAEHLTVAFYTRLLRVVAGSEPPSKGLEPTTKYQFLLPYFVLGGMAGLRTCELVRSEPTDPVLNWEDILWTKNLIHVRHEVAKQTRSRDHKRYVPLEPEAAKILKPLAGKGPIISCCDNHLYLYQEAGTSPGHENQIAGELSQEFVRDLCTYVPITRRSRKSNGGR